MASLPSFPEGQIEALARVLGECGSGTDISRVLRDRGLADDSGESTKWRRLYWVFLDCQKKYGCANHIVDFIRAFLTPARFVGRAEEFEARRDQLNAILAFAGLEYGADGHLRQVAAATTLDEAEKRVRTIRMKFQGRRIHPEVLKYCRTELMQDNYFHGVFEATKGLAQRLRDMTGVQNDGAALVETVFSIERPILAMNALRSDTEKSEHKGFAALLKGCFAAVRNPLAHEPKILWDGEDDAADYLSLISLLHRKLDQCVATGLGGDAMIGLLRTYPTMKDSGVRWLGAVPGSWGVMRSKRLFVPRIELARADDIQLSATQAYGVIPQADYERAVGRKVTKILQHLEKRRHVEVDDFVISMRSFQGGLERAWSKGCIRSSYVVLRSATPLVVGYYAYLLKSNGYIRALQSTASFIRDGQDLNFDNFCEVDLPFPPISDQSAIARFLGHADQRLRRHVRAKQKLIKRLEEQKQAIIHRAVTRGLDHNVRLKKSGVEWLGDVPEHWQPPVKIKFVAIMKGRLGWQGLKASEYTMEGPYVVSSAHFRNHIVNWDICPHVTAERYAMDENIQIAPGDVLLMKDGAAMGKLAFIDELPGPACLNSHLLLFRPNRSDLTFFPKFLFYFMQTACFQDFIRVNGTGATFLGISQESVKNYKVCLPPLFEQIAIVEWADRASRDLNTAIECAHREIDLFKEYRSRLITDAVTGKLDVREAAATLPDEVGEPDPIDRAEGETISDEAEEVDEELGAVSDEVQA